MLWWRVLPMSSWPSSQVGYLVEEGPLVCGSLHVLPMLRLSSMHELPLITSPIEKHVKDCRLTNDDIKEDGPRALLQCAAAVSAAHCCWEPGLVKCRGQIRTGFPVLSFTFLKFLVIKDWVVCLCFSQCIQALFYIVVKYNLSCVFVCVQTESKWMDECVPACCPCLRIVWCCMCGAGKCSCMNPAVLKAMLWKVSEV